MTADLVTDAETIRARESGAGEPQREWRADAAQEWSFAPPRRVLLVSAFYHLPYRVMRCAAATGAEVFALGTARSRGLAHSRFCQRFEETSAPIDGQGGEDLLEAINRSANALGVECVLPGDAPSTRSLIALRDRIAAPVFAGPDLASFDLLNDKARFQALCASAGVRTPETRIFANRAELEAALVSEELPEKAIAKPLSLDNSEGCVVLDRASWRARMDAIDYAPVVVQRFIEGEDIGASVFCRGGAVTAFVAHRYRRAVYRTFAAPRVREDIERLLGPLGVDGVFNFDMRLDREGGVHYLECNPRLFFKVAMSMLAGVNFVALGFGAPRDGPIELPARTVRFPRALALALVAPWRIERESLGALAFAFADPVPWLREEAGFETSPGRRANRTAPFPSPLTVARPAPVLAEQVDERRD